MATISPSRPTLRLFSRLKRRSLARKNARDFNKEEDIVDLQWGGSCSSKNKVYILYEISFQPGRSDFIYLKFSSRARIFGVTRFRRICPLLCCPPVMSVPPPSTGLHATPVTGLWAQGLACVVRGRFFLLLLLLSMRLRSNMYLFYQLCVMLLGCMRNMVIFPSNAKQIIAIIARIIKLERWYSWGVLQFFDIFNHIILCKILLTLLYTCH
jgi:hypothetical protein